MSADKLGLGVPDRPVVQRSGSMTFNQETPGSTPAGVTKRSYLFGCPAIRPELVGTEPGHPPMCGARGTRDRG